MKGSSRKNFKKVGQDWDLGDDIGPQ